MKHSAKGAINRKKVNVKVVGAKGLLAADFNGKSDPFVQIKVRNRSSVKQTSTKMKTLSPEWGEEFEFEIIDENNDYLDVTVYDWDKNGNNDFLGIASVPVAAVAHKGSPLEQQFPLLDRHAASVTHSKKDRGTIHLVITYTDSDGKTHSGSSAASAPPMGAAQPAGAVPPGYAQAAPQGVPMQAGGYPMGGQQPMMQQPMMQQPMMQQPMMQQPMMQQPMMQQPGMYQQPGMMMPGQPMMMPGQPMMQQPGMMMPGMPMMQPGMMQPGMMQPGMMQPGMQYPGQYPQGQQYPPPGGQYPPPQGGY